MSKAGTSKWIAPNLAERVQFVQSDPRLLCHIPPQNFDFVHSHMTLQHMVPMMQVAYIEQLCDALKSGGYGFFQVPTEIFDMTTRAHCNPAEDLSGDMSMHYTPHEEVISHLK